MNAHVWPFFRNPKVDIWCNLPALPMHLYYESALYMVCYALGNPIQVDRVTASRSRIFLLMFVLRLSLPSPLLRKLLLIFLGLRWNRELFGTESLVTAVIANMLGTLLKLVMPLERMIGRRSVILPVLASRFIEILVRLMLPVGPENS